MKYVLKTSGTPRPQIDLDADLNPQQRAVVEADPERLLVIAGAGTGKTRTLTYRVARLVQKGAHPERILLCTFTNRAAREMVARVETLLGIDMRRCSAGTFHHVGNRLLRRYGEHLGFGADFGILDPEDARTLLGSVIAEQGLGRLSARRFPTPKLLHSLIGLASGTRTSLAEMITERSPQLVPQLPSIEQVVARYAKRKREINSCDFDDLLALWHDLLAHERIGVELRGAYDHVLVDEYQDVTALQGSLCDAMAHSSGSLTCVGDDAQSIYSFRGADVTQIADFRRRHDDAAILKLTINYRSTPEILEFANRSISHNIRQHPKELSAVKREGMTPAVIPLRDVYQQAELIAQRVLELHHEQNLPLRKMAVLYRNHAHSLELQVELTRRQIPYAVRSGVRFFEQAHIKDVVAYLRARDNSHDELSWVRLLRQWPGVGAQTADRVANKIATSEQSPAEVIRKAAMDSRGRGRGALLKVAELFERLGTEEGDSPGAAIRSVVELHYAEYADRSFTNAAARREDLDHLAAYADRYDDARAFLSELALVQGMSAEHVVGAEAPDDNLVLSTVHQAKGLEWPIVFIMWLAEGRFPSAQALRVPAELEEERRLFYVATTRAADELYLLYPTVEEGTDGPSTLLRPSRFLKELDRAPAVFERWQIHEEPLPQD